MSRPPFDKAAIAHARAIAATPPPAETDPVLEELVNELIGQVADKWTMLVLEVLEDRGEQRFTQLARAVPGISQKMLTQTLRGMERKGLLVRTVHAVVPPRVDYRLTDLGQSLGAAFCGVWLWAEENMGRIRDAEAAFDRDATSAAAVRTVPAP